MRPTDILFSATLILALFPSCRKGTGNATASIENDYRNKWLGTYEVTGSVYNKRQAHNIPPM